MEFVNDVNVFFGRNGIAYELTGEGKARRTLPEPPAEMQRRPLLPARCSGDCVRMDQDAGAGFRQEGTGRAMLDLAASRDSKFRGMLDDEEVALTKCATASGSDTPRQPKKIWYRQRMWNTYRIHPSGSECSGRRQPKPGGHWEVPTTTEEIIGEDPDLLIELLKEMSRKPDGQISTTLTLGMSVEARKRRHHLELLSDAGLAEWKSDSRIRIKNFGYDFPQCPGSTRKAEQGKNILRLSSAA